MQALAGGTRHEIIALSGVAVVRGRINPTVRHEIRGRRVGLVLVEHNPPIAGGVSEASLGGVVHLVHVLARPDSDLGEVIHQPLLARHVRRVLRHRPVHRLPNRQVIGRGVGRPHVPIVGRHIGGPPEAQRRKPILGLDRMNVGQVIRIIDKGAARDQHIGRSGVGQRGDIGRAVGTRPIRPRNQVIPGVGPGGACAHIGEVVRVKARYFHRIIPVDSRHGQDHRLGR